MTATPITVNSVTHLTPVDIGVVTTTVGTPSGTGGNTVTVQDPTRTVLVIEVGATPGNITFNYAITPDGQAVTPLVISAGAQTANHVYVLANWPPALFGSVINVTCASATTSLFAVQI